MSTPDRDDLPSLPAGSQVTAWSAALPAGITLTPRLAMVLLLHATWLRWTEMAALLQADVQEEGAGAFAGEQKASGRSGVYATGEQVRALAIVEADERDRVARYAKQAFDMGITGGDAW